MKKLNMHAKVFNFVTSVKEMIAHIKRHKKELFWIWIAYQTIKGLITLTFIWLPLWLLWKT